MPDVTYWFRCPKCGEAACIDDDQANGLVSMVCSNEPCDFHEAGTVRPLVPTTTAMRPEDMPTWEMS